MTLPGKWRRLRELPSVGLPWSGGRSCGPARGGGLRVGLVAGGSATQPSRTSHLHRRLAVRPLTTPADRAVRHLCPRCETSARGSHPIEHLTRARPVVRATLRLPFSNWAARYLVSRTEAFSGRPGKEGCRLFSSAVVARCDSTNGNGDDEGVKGVGRKSAEDGKGDLGSKNRSVKQVSNSSDGSGGDKESLRPTSPSAADGEGDKSSGGGSAGGGWPKGTNVGHGYDPIMPRVLVIPVSRRPIFPNFLKHVVIKDRDLIKSISILNEKSPNKRVYVGVFLLKDDNADIDVIHDASQVYPVGSFAQISGSYMTTDESMVVVLRPIRRIRMEKLIYHHADRGANEEAATKANESENAEKTKHDAPAVEKSSQQQAVVNSETQDEAEAELVSVGGDGVEIRNESSDTNEHTRIVSDLAESLPVSVADVVPVASRPYNKSDEEIKAISNEMLTVIRNIANLQPFFKEQIASFSLSAGTGEVFEDPDRLADFAAAISSGEAEALQGVMESTDVRDKLEKSLLILKTELHNVEVQHRVSKEVESKISKKQKEYYLMEQLKGIKKELGLETDGKETLVRNFKEKADKLLMPEGVRKVFDEEINKLSSLEPAASEFSVTRNYLDWLIQIPWGIRSVENFNMKHARIVLDEDHHGLKDVKERILEFIAVGKLRGTVEGNILLLAGPPGVGKTSIGKSIARALERQFYRFSVGGLTDVAEIKGHRRTYVGSMPGKVIQALKKVKTENPLILIDEIDKLGRGHQGDPASALLELLDPEQNSSFLDHYMDVPVDLSKVLFVCTANMLDTIPSPLLDRMDVIQLSGYIADEKLAIATRYLAPQAKVAAGLEHANVTLHRDGVEALIRHYCRESGVRNLKKHVDKIFRKAALRVVQECPEIEELEKAAVDETARELADKRTADAAKDSADSATAAAGVAENANREEKSQIPASNVSTDGKPVASSKVTKESASEDPVIAVETSTIRRKPLPVPEYFKLDITADNLKDFVGPPVFSSDRLYDTTPAGVVMGLAWTSMGGSALYVESCLESPLTGREKADGRDNDKDKRSRGPSLSKTGQMGDVMKESTTIAYTFAKSLIARRFPENDFFDLAAIHLHVPEGATPKDGPSAGITMATSLLSLALDKPVSPVIAMTGELTLTGKVLKIGGLRDKAIAAKRSGVTTLIFPAANRADWDDLPENVREGLSGMPVDWYEDVYKIVFAGADRPPTPSEKSPVMDNPTGR